MLATKIRAIHGCLVPVALILVLSGCTPAGPKAVLDGKRLLDQGRSDEAIARLQAATALMPTKTNAIAWNYLGLAYHQAGQSTNAAAAYQRALSLDRNLIEARFNLGCLRLDEGNEDAAKAEFTAYTLRRPNAPEGWVKLGFAQLGSREITAAERSFSRAAQVDTNNADAFNGIGLAQLQRNHPKEAAQYFTAALRRDPDHRAALLNLARVSQAYLNDKPAALENYRHYLELKPRAADWDAITAIADSIEQPIAAAQKPVQPNPPPPAATIASTPTTTNPTPAPTPAVAPTTKPPAPAKTESAKPTPTIVAASKPAPTPVAPTRPAPPMDVVSVPPEPVIRTASAATSTAPAPVPTKTEPSSQDESTAVVSTPPPPPQKKGFFSKLNPMNLFHREPKVTPIPASTPQTEVSPAEKPADTSPAPAAIEESATPKPAPRVKAFARYSYTSPRVPPSGNRSDALLDFAQAEKMREAGRMSDAAEAFRKSAREDPSFYEAQFNLALAEFQLQQFKKSLPSWEVVLAIQPNNSDARYNFALALGAANYPLDAAVELEKILLANPDEVRAHLAAGNLYANQLQDKSRARTHYRKVLEIAPNHPQASAIHYWLVNNPS
jgi:tetratricopeptide (TPR) repeat protein